MRQLLRATVSLDIQECGHQLLVLMIDREEELLGRNALHLAAHKGVLITCDDEISPVQLCARTDEPVFEVGFVAPQRNAETGATATRPRRFSSASRAIASS